MICPHCGFKNPPRFKFCGDCGRPLTPSNSARATVTAEGQLLRERPVVAQEKIIPEPERRQLTVMFCDLVGSTKLAAQMDPEELREVVRDYQKMCAHVIGRFEGHIAQYLGDGILVYFGYPQAHEDDACRAVHSGLGILEGLKTLNNRLQEKRGISLSVRIGIHTGLVVVGEVGDDQRPERLALGETPNLAARLQNQAEANSIFISAATQRLVANRFALENLGLHPLKGTSQPMEIFKVLSEREASELFAEAGNIQLTSLIGKDQEIALLLDLWQRVKQGAGQTALITGEAGIGKSRLGRGLKERLAAEALTSLECRCSPYHQNSALYPLIEMLQRELAFTRKDSHEEKLAKLERMLATCCAPVRETVPLFASLLSIPLGDRFHALGLSPDQEKHKTRLAFRNWLLARAQQQPLVFVMDDLHWADPSTIELLGVLIEGCAPARVLIFLTGRPGPNLPWLHHPQVTHLTLKRLAPAQVESMIAELAHAKQLPEEVFSQLVSKTDGVPLFIEELTKMVLESGYLEERDNRYELRGSLPALAIPASLHDSLMARLDRLAAVKEVAQVAATLGREFSFELLAAVWPGDPETLRTELDRLVAAELLYEKNSETQTTYYFKHALIQDAAYESLLKSKRQHYHRLIARTLIDEFADTLGAQPEIVAHHFTEGGEPEYAISYRQWAGENAIAHSAHAEAIGHLKHGLELIAALRPSPLRNQQELDLLNALGVALIARKGYAAAEVEAVFTRAHEVSKETGHSLQIAPALLGLWEFALLRARLHQARDYSREFMQLAQASGDEEMHLSAELTTGVTLFHLGEVTAACGHFERAFAFYHHDHHASAAFIYGQDPGVVCLCYWVRALHLLGHTGQALESQREANALAEKLAHPFTQAFALYFDSRLHEWRGELEAALASVEILLKLAREQGFTFWLALGMISRGRVLILQNRFEQGIALMRQGMEICQASGAILSRPEGLCLLGYAYGAVNQLEAGLVCLEEAQTLINTSGEFLYQGEILRSRGELLQMLPGSHSAEVEACFQQALADNRMRRAKTSELRTAMSLSRWWQKQGRSIEARKALAEVYGWFKDGFETGDLKAAKALLEESS